MKTILLLFFTTLVFSLNSFAAVKPYFQDAKFPTQQMIEKQEIDNPVAADDDRIKTSFAGATSAAAVTVTSFTAQPDVPRNITITPGSTTGDVENCDVVITGTNIFDRTITETISISANASTIQNGSKAFKTVSSIVFPANCESGGFEATWKIGVGEKLGLKRCMKDAGHWLQSSVGGVKETTAATVTADEDEVEKNTADFNGTMDGSADFDAFFMQSYHPSCQP